MPVMNDISLPHRDWGNGTVPVDHAPDGATVLEIQCSRFNGYFVYGWWTPPIIWSAARCCAP
ncbi:hypothetical protein GCM10009801_10050 [Streptomyces albiaxialis]|uniref:Uncharacterized protein n=1 Tax=Streptomyces albiaxialis TaxID=329523 RepID=A0ABP5H523_9ACTN